MTAPLWFCEDFEGYYLPRQQDLLFAEDFGNLPGEFTQGPLALTESGLPLGNISPGGVVFFWAQWVPPSGGEIPPPIRFCVRGLAIEEEPRLVTRAVGLLRALLRRLVKR